MNILVLHNNNLPSFFLKKDEKNPLPKDIIITAVSVTLPKTDIPDFDSHISNVLIGTKKDRKIYDIIILPFNTTDNDLEYTGLRILAHLRLTKELNYVSTPILFVGPDTFQEVNQFCELGCLLNSFNVFISSINNQEEIISILRWIDKYTEIKDDIEDSSEYRDFLKRMKALSAPANYATHHSLANEWAIMRWNDMMSDSIILPNNDFTNMLYYKYLRACHGDSQKMAKWLKNNNHTNLEIIEGIPKGKKLVLIDDEWGKGWDLILQHIADNSGIIYDSCKIKKEWNRETLISNVKDYVDKNDADCYLLDLRLHDSDFDKVFLNKNKLRLSGYEILDHIKENNEANPVVVFSASNKLWNFKNTVWNYKISLLPKEGALDYVLKETPESVLNASDSYKLYNNFRNAIKISFKLSVLKNIVTKQKELKEIYPKISSIDEFYKLVLLDKGCDKPSIQKACLMNLMTFLEDYVKDRYEFLATGNGQTERLQLAQTEDFGGHTIEANVKEHIFVKRHQKENSNYSDIIDSYYTSECSEPMSLYVAINNKDIGLLLSVLYIKYRFNCEDINTYFLPMKNKRNTISHESNNITLSYNELYDFYFKIIVPVIEHDHKK